MIVVTTPTGSIGSKVAEKLLAADSAEPVRVIVRNAARLAATVRERVDVVEGSHDDAEVVDRAFDGADSLFWLVPPNFRAESPAAAYLDFTRPACEAIRQHQVKRVVAVSALGRGITRKAGVVTAAHDMCDMLAATGAALRELALPAFMDNMLWQVRSIRTSGVFFTPLNPAVAAPTCATADIADTAARLLLDSTWTAGHESVAVLGPEDLGPNDEARIMTDVLGVPVRCLQVPFEAYQADLLSHGASEGMVRGLVEMMLAKYAGLDAAEVRTPEKTSPTTFRQWCEEVLKPAVLAV